MAPSRDWVKAFERKDGLLPSGYMVKGMGMPLNIGPKAPTFGK